MPEINVEATARVVLQDRADAFIEFMARVLGIQPGELVQVRPQLEKMHGSLRDTFVTHLNEIHHLLHKAPRPPSPQPLTPELREWACRQHTEKEIVAGLREAREQNGPELKDLIQRREQELRGRDPANL